MPAPTVRSVKVRLEADVAKYIADMKAAGKATDSAFGRADAQIGRVDDRLSSTSRSLGQVNTQSRAASAGIAGLDRETARFGSTLGRNDSLIDRTSGRLRLLAETAVVAGPALAPLGAVAAVGVAGLASQLGLATVGALGLVAATQGVGDALSAVEKARLDPTVENLQAAEAAMSAITPEAREFVARFQELRPMLTDLRDSGQAELFPGLTESLSNLEQLEPVLTRLMAGVGSAAGDIAADVTESLASDRWAPFLEFLAVETPEAMRNLSALTGDLAHGAASMWMAFDPGNDAFIDWALDVGDAFDKWASSDAGRADVAAFLDYARQNGPKVADFFGSLVDATAQIVQAAAPLGGPVLTALTAVLDVIAAIADSDLGTPILGAVAAFSALNRVLALTGRAQTALFGGGAAGAGAGGAGAAAGGGFFGMWDRGATSIKSATSSLGSYNRAQEKVRVAQTDANRAIGTYLGQLQTQSTLQSKGIRPSVEAQARLVDSLGRVEMANYAVREATERANAAKAMQRQRFGQIASSAGKAGAAVAGLTVLTTGAADGMNLTNTASLALMGTMAGPWGAAIGGAVGLALDMKASFEQAADATEEFDAVFTDALASGDFTKASASISGLNDQIQQFDQDAGQLNLNDFNPATWGADLDYASGIIPGVTSGFEEMQAASSNAQQDLMALGDAGIRFADALGVQGVSASEAQAIGLERMAPAMDALGVSTEQVSAAMREGGPAADELLGQLEEWTLNSDSAAGRSQNLSDALTMMSGSALAAAQKAELYSSAMGAIVGPQLAAMSSADQLTYSTRHLGDALSSNSKTLKGNSDAAIQNRAAFGQQIQLMTQASEAALAADVPLRRVQRNMLDQSRALLRAGEAAGVSRQQMLRLLSAYEMTPKQIRTRIEAMGASQAGVTVGRLQRNYQSLPKGVRTAIRADGVPQTMGQVNALVNKYELTEKERRALISLKDAASGGIRNIIGLINSVHDKSVTITTRHVSVGSPIGTAANPTLNADGGTVPTTGRGYADRHHYLLADGEEVVSNRYGQADRNRSLLKAINANRLAIGGTAGVSRADSLIASTHARSWRDPALDDLSRQARTLATSLGRLDRSSRDFEQGNHQRNEHALKERVKEARSRAELLRQEADNARETFRSIREARNQLMADVRNNLRAPLVGEAREDTTVQSILDSDIYVDDDARRRALIAVLKARGATGAVVDNAMAEGSVDELANLASQYNPQNAPGVGITQNLTRIREAIRLYEELQARGFDGKVFRELAANADVETLRVYAALPDERLQEIKGVYRQQQQLLAQAGQVVGSDYDKQLKAAGRIADRIDASADRAEERLKRLEKLLDKANRQAEKAPKETGQFVGEALNKARAAGRAGRS